MKRCPQCQFIYPDSDELCDFDQTPLAIVTDSEIDAASHSIDRPALADLANSHSSAIANRRSRKALPIAAGIGLILGVIVFAVYYAVSSNRAPAAQVASATPTPIVVPSLTVSVAAPSPSPSPTPSESPTKNAATSGKNKPAQSNLSTGPVSTSTDAGSKAKPVILLTSGGRVEADEVWRTKEGVWYRKNGVVTLLKKNRVKAIVNQ